MADRLALSASMVLGGLLLCVGSSFADAAADIEAYVAALDQRLFEAGRINDPDAEADAFAYSIFPITPEYVILQEYSGWKQRGFTLEKMIDRSKMIAAQSKSKIWARLVVGMKDPATDAESSRVVHNTFYQHIFLENDHNQAVRACPIDDTPWTMTVDAQRPKAELAIWFPRHSQDGITILHQTEQLRFLMEDRHLHNSPAIFPSSFDGLFADSPREVQELFVAAGIWESMLADEGV